MKETLNLEIDWSALTEYEQIKLHHLLSKAHTACKKEKITVYRIIREREDGVITETDERYFDSLHAENRCDYLNRTMGTCLGRYSWRAEENECK